MYTAKVRWDGNHYFQNQEVTGSEIRTLPDGRVELFDDEHDYVAGLGDFTRNEWVEVFPKSVKEISEINK